MEALYNTRNRRERILFARQKYNQGYTQSEIALLLHSAISIVEKYLKISEEEISEALSFSRERQHQDEMSKKKAKIDEVKIMFQNSDLIEVICRKTGHTYQTVINYIFGSYSLVNSHYDNRIPGKLQKYEAEVVLLRSQDMTYKKITKIIRQKGYTGTVDVLRVFMQKNVNIRKILGYKRKKAKRNILYVNR
jgi:predicted transcriptional regulator